MARKTANGAIVADNGQWYWAGPPNKWESLVANPTEKSPSYWSKERSSIGLTVRPPKDPRAAGEQLKTLMHEHGSLEAAESALAQLMPASAQMVAAAADPKAVIESHYAADGPAGMIQTLPDRLNKPLAGMLGPDEQVFVMLQGTFKEGLICTDHRVIILKGGFMTNQTFGTNTFQLPYANIAGADVKAHLTTGYFQVNAGGMDQVHQSYWSNKRGSDPKQAPNSVSLTRDKFATFQQAAAFIMAKVAEAHNTRVAVVNAPAAVSKEKTVLEALEQLGKLKDAGVLTQDEFDAKKAELLTRL